MANFGWIAGEPAPPAQWDLRRIGWTLCRGHSGWRAECRHVLLCDTRDLSPPQRKALVGSDGPVLRLILLGVEDPSERADLISVGCADALSADTGLHELDARSRRAAEMFGMLPRWRNIGSLTLDLLHRDARKDNRWLGLHPREFEVLWRLADTPGERVTRRQLVAEVWRLKHEPETNSVEVHVSRLRTKLASARCDDYVQTAPEGGYRLAGAEPFMLDTSSPRSDALDDYLRDLGWAGEDA